MQHHQSDKSKLPYSENICENWEDHSITNQKIDSNNRQENELNKLSQKEEIEVLESMYAESFIRLDDKINKFIIGIKEYINDKETCVEIEIEFPEDYPMTSSAIFRLNSAHLNTSELNHISKLLTNLSLENKETPIVYIWVEAIRQNLLDNNKVEDNNLNSNLNELTLEQEEDAEDYEQNEYEYHNDFQKEMVVHEFGLPHNHGNDLPLPDIIDGEFVRDRKSVFQGHLAAVIDKRQVDMVVSKLKENKKVAEATHNIIAYRIDGHNGYFISGCHDDGEIHAGSRMLHLMNLVDARDVLVVVTRWYGGIHLGADRYKHINNITRDLLDQYGYIKDKPNKKKQETKKNSVVKLKR